MFYAFPRLPRGSSGGHECCGAQRKKLSAKRTFRNVKPFLNPWKLHETPWSFQRSGKVYIPETSGRLQHSFTQCLIPVQVSLESHRYSYSVINVKNFLLTSKTQFSSKVEPSLIHESCRRRTRLSRDLKALKIA